MSRAWHCDADGCDTWSRNPLAHDFIKCNCDDSVLHFCSWDCVLRFAGSKHPIVEVKL